MENDQKMQSGGEENEFVFKLGEFEMFLWNTGGHIR